jgi:hypothetical protein
MNSEVVGFFTPTFSVGYSAFEPASRRDTLIEAVRDYDHKARRSSVGFADKMIETACQQGGTRRAAQDRRCEAGGTGPKSRGPVISGFCAGQTSTLKPQIIGNCRSRQGNTGHGYASVYPSCLPHP